MWIWSKDEICGALKKSKVSIIESFAIKRIKAFVENANAQPSNNSNLGH